MSQPIGSHQWDPNADRCSRCGLSSETLCNVGERPADFPCSGQKPKKAPLRETLAPNAERLL